MYNKSDVTLAFTLQLCKNEPTYLGIMEVFNDIKYFILEVRYVEITEDRAKDRTHRYLICLNVNIIKTVKKWDFSSTC